MEDYVSFLTERNYIYSVDNWIPLFEADSKGVFDVQIVPIENLRVTLDNSQYIKAYGMNGEFIITAKDNSKQVVIDYATGMATIFSGGIVYIIAPEETVKKEKYEYR